MAKEIIFFLMHVFLMITNLQFLNHFLRSLISARPFLLLKKISIAEI